MHRFQNLGSKLFEGYGVIMFTYTFQNKITFINKFSF